MFFNKIEFLTFFISHFKLIIDIKKAISYNKKKQQKKNKPNLRPFSLIGFTFLYFKMTVIPLVPETKMADVGKLIILGNLLVRNDT